MKKVTLALSAATALASAAVGFASPALASPPVDSGPAVVSSSGANIPKYADTKVLSVDPRMLAQCDVHVNYNGADVNVNWC